MRTDEEIKQWIDEREVLTRAELKIFIYGYQNGTNLLDKIWWDYVLQTKKWNKLREYREDKIKNPRTEIRYKEICEIMKNDIRFNDVGKRRAQTLIKNIYNQDIPLATVGRYLKRIRETKNVIN